ncbi:MAG: MraY family glycosyltransferase, partial [Gemmatimonadaceae bacterium]
RMHARAVPRLGGVGVFAGFLVALGLGVLLEGLTRGAARHVPPTAVPLVVACSILFVIGLLDDLRGVRPLVKLVGQTAAALIVCQAGFRIAALGFSANATVSLGFLAVPVTVLWLVGVSNAFNLVDGLDGLAAGVGIVALSAVVVAKSILGGQPPLYSMALAGALLGFLCFNRHPARIFLGDSGSLVVGFLLAYLTARGATRADGVLLPLVPLCALAYPLLDTGIAMLRRWLRGDPLSRADRRHIHHQLRAVGLPASRAVKVICLLSAFVAALGLCATFVPPRYTVLALLLTGGAVIMLLGYGLPWLRYHEFVEVGASLNSLVRTGRHVVRNKILARDVAGQVRLAPTLDALAEELERGAGVLRFVHMELQGAGDAAWRDTPAAVQLHPHETWRLEYPVMRAGSPTAQPIYLSIWCSMVSVEMPWSADRVAKIIAPAVADWFARNWHRPDVQAVLESRFASGPRAVAGSLAADLARREPAVRQLAH